jgi:hypothetical protein
MISQAMLCRLGQGLTKNMVFEKCNQTIGQIQGRRSKFGRAFKRSDPSEASRVAKRGE